MTFNLVLYEQMIPNGSICFPMIDMEPDMSNSFHFNPLQHPLSSREMGVNLDMGLRRTTSAPISIPETFNDSYPVIFTDPYCMNYTLYS